MHPEATGFRVGPYPSGGIDEQAREETRRTGRATANPAVAEQAGRRPAWPAVAEQAGQPARAQADHLADAARPKPLDPTSISGAPPTRWGVAAFPGQSLR